MVLAVDSTLVRWIETEINVRRKTETVTLKSAPLDLGAILYDAIWQHVDAAVLVSATLAVDGGFEHHGKRLGVPSGFESLNVGTPFDFTTQARLYVPRHIPAPDANGRAAWNAMSVNEIKELVLASKGRALVLFTSIAQMKTAYDILVRTVPYTVLMQGHGGLSNKELAARFKEEEDSVLLGTKSFFTGVDLAGDTCSLVIIDKLPFPVPTEPLVSAQTDLIEERGGNSFADFTIPEMVLPLQQGFGRLIRTKRDKGVVAILDPRLVTKGYGKRIIRSLPNSPVVSSLDDVKAFFAEIDSEDR
jgi:ATP-dependent DNA helicase DinG